MKTFLAIGFLLLSLAASAVDLCEDNVVNLTDKVEDYWASPTRCKEGFFLSSIRGELPGTRRGCWKEKEFFLKEWHCSGNRVYDEEFECVSSTNTAIRSSKRKITVRTRKTGVSCSYPKCDDDAGKFELME